MTDTSSVTATELRRWACAKLCVAPDATREQATAAFLNLVAEASFRPEPASLDAWRLLTADAGMQLTVAPAAVAELAEGVEVDIESLAREFFALPSPDRRRRLSELQKRCGMLRGVSTRFSPLATWLAALSEGVDMDQAELPPPTTPERDLADELERLFVMRPDARVWLRQKWLGSRAGEGKDWTTAARRLRRATPRC